MNHFYFLVWITFANIAATIAAGQSDGRAHDEIPALALERINKLNVLADSLRRVDPERSLNVIEESFHLSDSLKYSTGKNIS